MPPGRILFLNGSSSAGKTSLAQALQDRLDQPYLHIALDQFRDGLPPAYRGLNAPEGTQGAQGLNVVPVGDPPYTDIRFGEVGKTMLRGMRRAIAAMAMAGNNLLIDDIILDPSFLDDYLDCLHDLDVYFVGVRCPLKVIEARENARPGRFPGTALGHYHTAHAHNLYDVEVDTSTHTPEQCAELVIDHLQHNKAKAFAELFLRRRVENETCE